MTTYLADSALQAFRETISNLTHLTDKMTKGKGTLLGTPNWEPQEYSRYIIGIYLPGSLYTIIFLLYSWGSLFGVPSRVPLKGVFQTSALCGDNKF